MKQGRKVEKAVKKFSAKVKRKPSSLPIKKVSKCDDSAIIDQECKKQSKVLAKGPRKSSRNSKNKDKNKILSSNSDVELKESEGKEQEASPTQDDELEESENEQADESGETKDKEKKSTKKRNPYTVFVGNLPYTATPEEVRKHFEKAGIVKEVRLPTDRKTNKRRGFGYVQLKDRNSYEKVLSLHHSQILGRQINVEYTTQGKKGGPKEEKIKQKNLKLRALSKRGILPSVSRTKKVIKGKRNVKIESENPPEIQQATEKKKKKK